MTYDAWGLTVNVPVWEFFVRVAFMVLCWVTSIAMAYGLWLRYLRPRPLFVYMFVAVVLYSVARTLLVWMGMLTPQERDEVVAYVTTYAALTGLILVQSVLLMVLWRIVEGKALRKAANNLLDAESAKMDSSDD